MTELDHLALNDEAILMLTATMNQRCKDALKVYVKHFLDKPDVVSAQIIGIEQTSFSLRYWDAADKCNEGTLNYKSTAGDDVSVSSAGDARRSFVEMARIASTATGDELSLPCGAAIGCHECDKMPGAFLLNDLVDMATVECLNQDDAHPVSNAICRYLPDQERVADYALHSDPDSDQELLIKLAFSQPVKLKAITFCGSSEDGTGPHTVKVFHGKMHIGFEEATDQEAVQTLELSKCAVDAGDPFPLRFVKFQYVNSLQLFVAANFGGDITRIPLLQFWGVPADAVDMKAWRPVTDTLANPMNPLSEGTKDEPHSDAGAK